MCANAKRRLHILLRFLLQSYGTVGVQSVGKNDLLRLGVNAQTPIFGTNLLQLLHVIAGINAQALEEVGEVFGEVQREDVPAEGVVEKGAERSVEGVSPGVHSNVVGHLRTIHTSYGCYELMRHRADRCQIVLHGEIDVARTDEPAFPVACLLAVFHGSDHSVLSLE